MATKETKSVNKPEKLEDNVMAVLATIPIVGLIIYFGMKDLTDLVKFYAKQGIGLLIVSIAMGFVQGVVSLMFVPFDFFGFLETLIQCFFFLLWMALFVVWVILAVKAYQREKLRLPVLADTMDRILK